MESLREEAPNYTPEDVAMVLPALRVLLVDDAPTRIAAAFTIGTFGPKAIAAETDLELLVRDPAVGRVVQIALEKLRGQRAPR